MDPNKPREVEHLDCPLCGCDACQEIFPLPWEDTTQAGRFDGPYLPSRFDVFYPPLRES